MIPPDPEAVALRQTLATFLALLENAGDAERTRLLADFTTIFASAPPDPATQSRGVD